MTLVNSIQGPTPWRKFRVTVGGSSTVNVDTIPLSTMKSVKYFISISNEANNRYKSFELNARNHNSDVRDTISNKQRTGVTNVDVEMKIDGSNAVLEFINNETFDLDVELIRGVLNG